MPDRRQSQATLLRKTLGNNNSCMQTLGRCIVGGMRTDFAIQKAGNANKLAKLLGVSPQAVRQWGPMMPPLRVYQLRDIKPRWVAEYRRQQA